MGNDMILITDEHVTNLLIKLFEKSKKYFIENIPNLSDYSTHMRTIK